VEVEEEAAAVVVAAVVVAALGSLPASTDQSKFDLRSPSPSPKSCNCQQSMACRR
jgi:hypothetical protein